MDDWAHYANPAPVLADLALACLGAGEFEGTDAGFRGRRLRSHAATLVSAGDGWYASALTGELHVRAPALIWLSPGVEHGYGPTREGWTEHWILFTGPAARAFEQLGSWRPSRPVIALDSAPATLTSTFSQLRSDLSSSAATTGSIRASAACYAWLSALVAASASGAPPDLVDAFTRDAALPLSMPARARGLGVDLATLRGMLVAATGLTPLQLLIETRLAQAQSLLAETDIEIGQIAQRVGFDDPAYFSRQFSRRLGASPTAFRREQRREKVPERADS